MLLNLGIKSAWILVNNLVQDELGHEAFGTFMALYALGFLFLALADMGINQYTTKTLAGDPDLLQQLFPNLFGLKLFFSSVYPFFMVGVGWLFGYEGVHLWFLFLLCGVHGIVQMIFFFRANFQAFQQFKTDAFASILDRAILLGIAGVLLTTQIDLELYIWANLASVGITLVVLFAILVRAVGWIRPRWEGDSAKRLLKESFPFAVITVLYSINDKVDQVMLERILGDEGAHATGLYAGAYRWVDAVMMYLWTVLPIFFARFAKFVHDREELDRLLAFGQPIAAIPMIFAAGFVFVYGEKLLWLFGNSTPEELAVMEACLKILFVAVLINGLFAIFSTVLTSTNHERFVSWMIFVSILLNVTLNFVYIPEYGALASAATTVVSFGFLSLSYLVYIHFRLSIRVPFAQLLKLLGVTGLFGLAFWGIDQCGWPWYFNSFLAGWVLLGLVFLFNLVKFRNRFGSED